MNFPFVAAPKWWEHAACRREEIPLSLFFTREIAAEAKRVCVRCDARYDCLSAHLEEPFGVWGGHPKDERGRILSLMEAGSSLREASRLIDTRRKG